MTRSDEGLREAGTHRNRNALSEPLSGRTAAELRTLQHFVNDLVERETRGGAGPEYLAALDEWRTAVLSSLPDGDAEPALVALAEQTYTTVAIERTSRGRTFRLNVAIDNDFGDDGITQVQRMCETMLERVAAGQTAEFIQTADEFGLNWRRSRNLAFPHPLPYASPPPSMDAGRYAEEAGVIDAAFRWVLERDAPGIDLTINQFAQQDNDGYWVLGSAPVNLYNDEQTLRMQLNSLALPVFDDDVWAGTVAHELMHNLGWGHPNGGYHRSRAIVNYDWCVRTEDAELLGFDDSRLIR